MFDYQNVRDGLETLHQAALALERYHKDQAKEFIEVGEYGLALDTIADAYLVSEVSMEADHFSLFEKLATSMDLASDPEYSGVAQLRKAQLAAAYPAASRSDPGRAPLSRARRTASSSP